MNYDIRITYGEIVYKEVVDFTPGDGSCALTHIRNKHAYVGVCFNDFHVEVLHKFLIKKVLRAFAASGDPLFQAAYASGMAKDEKAQPKAKPKQKSKKAGEKKSKKKKKTSKRKKQQVPPPQPARCPASALTWLRCAWCARRAASCLAAVGPQRQANVFSCVVIIALAKGSPAEGLALQLSTIMLLFVALQKGLLCN